MTRFRAYDVNIGRWLSRDSIGENGGYNLYGYCIDDPTNLLDPTGKSCATWIAGGTVIGAGGGLILFFWTGPGDVAAGAAGYALGGAAVGALTGCAFGTIDLTHVPPITFSSTSNPSSPSSTSVPDHAPRSLQECKKGDECEWRYAWCKAGQASEMKDPVTDLYKPFWSQFDCEANYFKCKAGGGWPEDQWPKNFPYKDKNGKIVWPKKG